jgi:hypothetical protein
MQKLCLTLLLATTFASQTALAQTDWVKVASSKSSGGVWEGKSSSLDYSKTKAGVPIIVVVGRKSDTTTQAVSLHKWYVTVDDCRSKKGKVVTLKVTGEFEFENDFAFGGDTVATSLAEFVCGVSTPVPLPVPQPAVATAATTVKVGKFIKQTSGVLNKLENGDTACYLSLKGDDGKPFDEMGNFSICIEQASLIGKRVTLSYALGTVVSDECGGDENCKKTKTVALVTGVKAMGK